MTITTVLDAAPVRGERALLERTIANLVENGIRHNVADGWLSVRTGQADGGSRVIVAQRRAGHRPGRSDGLTEPFRRLDPAREGFGLGLSIVRSVIAAHGGRLALRRAGLRRAGGRGVAAVHHRAAPAEC